MLLKSCSTWYDCQQFEYSLIDFELREPSQPYFKVEVIDLDTYKFRLALIDPLAGNIKATLQCTDEMASCYQEIFFGSMQDEELYLVQSYQRQLYDGRRMTDLYRLDTRSLEISQVDQFPGTLSYFYPISGSRKGLLGTLGQTFLGELVLYDLDTHERVSILKRRGQFFRIGPTPDERVFWYRIADYCETELVSKDGQRIASIKDSDGIIGWIDNETFLLFAASNNPPICTRTGIALANRYGLTGEWIAITRSDWAKLSQDGKTLFFISDCNSRGCSKLMRLDLPAGNPQMVVENSDRFNSFDSQAAFSPDGTKMLFSGGKQVLLVDGDGSNSQILLDSGGNWQIVGWLDE